MKYVLTIAEPGKAPKRVVLEEGVHVIGRGFACHVRLDDPGASERHASLTLRNGKAVLEDLHSSNGTQVDGRELVAPARLSPSSVSNLGSTLLRVEVAPEEKPPEPKPAPVAKTQSAPDPREAILRDVKTQIHRELVQRLDLKRMTADGAGQEELQRKVGATLREIVLEVRRNGKLPPGIDSSRLEKELYDEAMRLGPLEELLDDDSVTEIMVNGPRKIYVERSGKLELTGKSFMDDASVLATIERIVAPIGRRIDESQPYVDARLADGSRVNAIIAPLSLSGPCLTIRKFSRRALAVDDMIRFGTFTRQAAEFLRICVLLRKNIVVAGGTGSGKTTLLNVLSSFIPHNERIVTIEDAAELRLGQPHVVRLEARPPNMEGRGAVTIRDLVRNALRMRPDRIIVGECRGGEALDMLQAMNTGHDGSLTTIHANAPRDVVSRLETMALMSGVELPSRAIREQIASAVGIVVHESRLGDGSRKVVCISEVTGMEGQQIVMQDIFEFKQSGVSPDGKVEGTFRPTGAIPTFFGEIRRRGLELPASFFDPSAEETA